VRCAKRKSTKSGSCATEANCRTLKIFRTKISLVVCAPKSIWRDFGMAITKRVYWDACSWIALIQKEKILQPAGAVEDREMICKSVIEAARK